MRGKMTAHEKNKKEAMEKIENSNVSPLQREGSLGGPVYAMDNEGDKKKSIIPIKPSESRELASHKSRGAKTKQSTRGKGTAHEKNKKEAMEKIENSNVSPLQREGSLGGPVYAMDDQGDKKKSIVPTKPSASSELASRKAS
jgi:hypothetical protein